MQGERQSTAVWASNNPSTTTDYCTQKIANNTKLIMQPQTTDDT